MLEAARPETPAESSDLDDVEMRIETAKIVSVRGQHLLLCAAGTDDDVSIDDVRSSGGGQQPPNVRRVDAVKGNDICVRLTDQSSKPNLPLGPPDRLCQRSGRHRDPSSGLCGAGKEHDDRPLVAVDGDQAASVQRDPNCHAAERFVFFLPVPRMRSAHSRSSVVSSPPV